jgi:hypothetical protein
MPRIHATLPLRKSDGWMTPRQVSEATHIAMQTLANNRSLGVGLPFVKLPSGRIQYRSADVEALLSQGIPA